MNIDKKIEDFNTGFEDLWKKLEGCIDSHLESASNHPLDTGGPGT